MEDRRVLAPGCAGLVETRRQSAAVVVLEAVEDGLPVVARGRVLERAAEVVLAVEVRADGGGVERRPGGELDPVPEVEGPVLTVPEPPLRGQPRPDRSRTRLN